MSLVRLCIVGASDIYVDDKRIGPSATHLFALLLLLSLRRASYLSRQELQRHLFPEGVGARSLAHNLRQLIYRARRLGLGIEDSGAGIRLTNATVVDPIARLAGLSQLARAALPVRELRVLPHYDPALPRLYSEWLDAATEGLRRQVVDILLSDLAAFRTSASWLEAVSISEKLRELGEYTTVVARTHAEALALLGHREAALNAIDEFLSEDANFPFASELRPLRARISRQTASHAGRIYGRTEAFAFLESQWDLSAKGGGRVSLLIGAGGIGKSRIAEAFSDRIKLGRTQVLWHRCNAQTGEYPLALLSSILPQLRAMRGSIGASPAFAPLLDRLSTTPATSVGLAPDAFSIEAIRSDLQSAAIDLIEAITSEGRILLVVDDAHYLDEASCSILRSLSAGANSAAIHIVACNRPSSRNLALLDRGERVACHVLKPLSLSDARSLLLELPSHRQLRADELDWCLKESAGNPFFLHSLAKHCISTHGSCGTLPRDVHSLAARLYYCLDSTSRLLLESCLYLSPHTSLPRLSRVSHLDDSAMLQGLRSLEELDLVRVEGIHVVGPHLLLHDAIRSLVPTSVAAMIKHRIAHTLANECSADAFTPAIALAAAEALISVSECDAAWLLLQRCAKQAATVGEPAAAAELLAKLLRAPLPLTTRRTMLEETISYADAAGLRGLVAECLRELMATATQLAESPSSIRALEIRLIEADLLNGADLAAAVDPLARIVDNPACDQGHRVRALVALLVIADAEYDAPLARRLMRTLGSGSPGSAEGSGPDLYDDSDGDLLRAHLVYHTTFGDTAQAVTIVGRLLERFPAPSMIPECRIARRFASFALYRMLRTSDAKRILEADYHLMVRNNIRSEALYSASLLTEIAISEGDLLAACAWFADTTALLRGAEAHKLSPNSGYCSSAALLAMMAGDYAHADAIIAQPQAEYGRMRTARYEAISGALRLRLYMMQGRLLEYPALIRRLQDLYVRGRSFGGQDTIVEVLWCHEILQGRQEEASRLLTEYLEHHRREPSSAEWLLRHTSGADEAWRLAQRRPPAEITRRKLDRVLTRSAGGNSQAQKSLASS